MEPRAARARIVARIQALAQSPRPHGSQKLAGEQSLYRLRQGPYRIVYAIDDERRIVEVFKVGHRREVYR